MPYRAHSLTIDPGLTSSSTAGTGASNNSPTEGMGHNPERRREPARTHRDGGGRYTLRRPATTTADDAPPSNGQTPGRGRPTPDENHRSGNPTLGIPETRIRNEPNGTLSQPKRKRKQFKMASLNMNGRGSRAVDKWGTINTTMRRRKIAILGLQETHPDDDLQETIEQRFRNTLCVVHSADPENPRNTNGVSIAINKGLIDAKSVTDRTVIPGRVLLIEIPWNEQDRLRIMNVYAPAQGEEKAIFWENLWNLIEGDESLQPDIMLGDFNLVENPELDRLNNRRGADPPVARTALSQLVTELNLADGWRRRHPKKRGYTFTGNGQSRLYRIYTKEDIYPWCTDWGIEHPGFKTDHNMVHMQVTSENMPYIGKGRWAIPVNLLKNKILKKKVQELAKQMQLDSTMTPLGTATTADPQRALKTFKKKVVETFREYQRTHQPKLENAIRSLQKELEDKANTPGLTADEIQEQSGLLAERIEALEKKRRDGARLLGSARNRLEGETMTKYWARSAKESTPRDTIRSSPYRKSTLFPDFVPEQRNFFPGVE